MSYPDVVSFDLTCESLANLGFARAFRLAGVFLPGTIACKGELVMVADDLSRPRMPVPYAEIDSIDARNSASISVLTRAQAKKSAQNTSRNPNEPTIPPPETKKTSSTDLNPGDMSYDEYCLACHGDKS